MRKKNTKNNSNPQKSRQKPEQTGKLKFTTIFINKIAVQAKGIPQSRHVFVYRAKRLTDSAINTNK